MMRSGEEESARKQKKPICSNCERLGLECKSGDFIRYSAWCTPGQDDSDNPQQEVVSMENDAPAWDPQTVAPHTSTWDNVSASLLGSSRPSTALTPPIKASEDTRSQPLISLIPEMVYLLNKHRQDLATWMDVFDFSGTYQREVSRRALSSQLLLRCICAFTTHHLGLRTSGEAWVSIARNYYTQSLNLLIQQLKTPEPGPDALTAVIILGSYEVLAEQGREHRRHYEGAMKLIQMQGINAQSVGLDRANFWIWIRHEIAIAIANKSPLQLSPSDWNVNWREREADEDMLGNQILWLAGRAVNWIYAAGTATEYHDLLWDINEWYTRLPQTFRGIKYGALVEDGLCKVHFAVPQSAAAMLWYHLLHILLYAEPMLRDDAYAPKIQEHATEIINVLISDIPDQVRCFSTFPLYYAGKHINSIARKIRVLALLNNIQTKLGYHTRGLVEELQNSLVPTN